MDFNEDELEIQLRYVGERFEDARLPVDVLGDLQAFRDLVVAFARQQWRDVYQRKRVPQGFDQSLSFDLSEIKKGSAVPLLKWNRAAAQFSLPDFADGLTPIVSEALRRVVGLIDDAACGQFPAALPAEHIRALNRFGSGLRPNERIEFIGGTGGSGKVVYLNSERRKEIITRVRETYVLRFEGSGIVVGVYAPLDGNCHIDVETESYGRIVIPVERELAINELNGSIDSHVQFDVEVELDNRDSFRRVVDAHSLALIDEKVVSDIDRCRKRLEQLTSLADGWDEGEGSRVAKIASKAAAEFIEKRPGMASHYRLFPTHEGGVLLEFRASGWDLSLEFESTGAIDFFGVEIAGDGEVKPMSFERVSDALIKKFDEYAGMYGH